MATQNNVINDVGTLLKVPNKVLDKLTDKMNLCIGSTICSAKDEGLDAVVINIGIGTLSVNLIDMTCKFVPSKDLKNTIKRCITMNVDPLELALEEELSDRLIAVCEETL